MPLKSHSAASGSHWPEASACSWESRFSCILNPSLAAFGIQKLHLAALEFVFPALVFVSLILPYSEGPKKKNNYTSIVSNEPYKSLLKTKCTVQNGYQTRSNSFGAIYVLKCGRWRDVR